MAEREPDYQTLEEFRYRIRRFLHFSETAARESGLEPQQHQALLVLKAVPAGTAATVGHLAERLFLKHHSAVGLVDRLEKLGLVARRPCPEDGRQVLLHLTGTGERVLHRLSVAHRDELDEAGPQLAAALRTLSRKRTQVE